MDIIATNRLEASKRVLIKRPRKFNPPSEATGQGKRFEKATPQKKPREWSMVLVGNNAAVRNTRLPFRYKLVAVVTLLVKS